VVLVLVLVAGFLGFLATHAVKSRLVDEAYYQDALASSNVYDRLYDELLLDPEFAPQVDALLGGVDIPREKIVVTLKELIKPEYLRQIVNAIVAQLVSYMHEGKKLELTLDITPIVEGVYQFAIKTVVQILDTLPVKQNQSFEEFVQEFQMVLQALKAEGAPPAAIPSYPIPEEAQEQVVLILLGTAGIDPQTEQGQAAGYQLLALVQQNNVAGAIKLTAAQLLDNLIRSKIRELSENKYVQKLESETGIHLLLGPTPAQTESVADKLSIVQQIDGAASWARPLCAALVLLCAAGLFLVWRSDGRRRFLWPGVSLGVAGVLGAVGWLIARGMVESRATDMVEGKTSLPASLGALLSGVIVERVGGMGTAIFIPSAIVGVAGIVLIVLGLRAKSPAMA